MKRLLYRFLPLLALAGSVVSRAENPVVLNGKWDIHIAIADRESNQTCNFTQAGSDLTGSCTSDRGTAMLSGKVDGQKITWAYKIGSDGGAVTLQYRGAMKSATEMTGFVTVQEYGVEGEFRAAPSK